MIDLKLKTALVVVDMQNGFIHANGTFGKAGMDLSHMNEVIKPIGHLARLCREKGLTIVYTRVGFAADYSDAGLLLRPMPGVKELKGFIRGTWDFEVIDDLKPWSGDLIIDKTRNSSFCKTELEGELKGRGIEQLIVTGVGTNVCVESTVRDAISLDFWPLIVKDATATLSIEEHEASIRAMSYFGQAVSMQEVEEALKADRSNGQ